MGRLSEKKAEEAFDHYREGNLEAFVMTLVDYADRGVNNHTTERIFKDAIREEIAKLDE